jgi:hypothetical protein
LVIDLFFCQNKARKSPNLASHVSNISFTDWAILSSVSALWGHTSSVSSENLCVAHLLVVRRKKRKEKKYLIYEKEEKRQIF